MSLMFSSLNQIMNIKTYLYNFQADLESVRLASKQSAKLIILWTRGDKQTQSSQYEYEPPTLAINQSISLNVKMYKNHQTSIFLPKISKLSVFLLMKEKKKEFGYVHIDLAQVLNKSLFQNWQFPFERGAQKGGIRLKIKAEFITQLFQNNVESNTLLSGNSLSNKLDQSFSSQEISQGKNKKLRRARSFWKQYQSKQSLNFKQKQERISSLKSKMNQKNQKLKKKQQLLLVNQLQSKLRTVSLQLKTAQEQVQRLRLQLQLKQGVIKECNRMNNELNCSIKRQTKQLQQKNSLSIERISYLQEQNHKLQTLIYKIKNQISIEQSKAIQFKSQNEQLLTQNLQLKKYLQQKIQFINDKDEDFQQLQQNARVLAQRVKLLQTEKASLLMRIEQLQQKLQQQDNKFKKLNQKLQSKQIAINLQSQKYTALKQNQNNLEVQCAKMQLQLKLLKEQNSHIIEQRELHEQKIQLLKSYYQRKQSSFGQNRFEGMSGIDNVIKLNEVISSRSEEISRLRQISVQQTQQIRSLQEDLKLQIAKQKRKVVYSYIKYFRKQIVKMHQLKEQVYKLKSLFSKFCNNFQRDMIRQKQKIDNRASQLICASKNGLLQLQRRSAELMREKSAIEQERNVLQYRIKEQTRARQQLQRSLGQKQQEINFLKNQNLMIVSNLNKSPIKNHQDGYFEHLLKFMIQKSETSWQAQIQTLKSKLLTKQSYQIELKEYLQQLGERLQQAQAFGLKARNELQNQALLIYSLRLQNQQLFKTNQTLKQISEKFKIVQHNILKTHPLDSLYKNLHQDLANVTLRVDDLNNLVNRQVQNHSFQLYDNFLKRIELSFTTFKTQSKSTTEQNSSRLSQQESVSEGRDQFCNRMAASQEQNKRLRMQVESRQQQNSELQKQVNRLGRERRELQVQVQDLSSQVQSFREQLEISHQMKELYSNSSKYIQKLEQQIIALKFSNELQIRDLQSSLQRTRQEASFEKQKLVRWLQENEVQPLSDIGLQRRERAQLRSKWQNSQLKRRLVQQEYQQKLKLVASQREALIQQLNQKAQLISTLQSNLQSSNTQLKLTQTRITQQLQAQKLRFDNCLQAKENCQTQLKTCMSKCKILMESQNSLQLQSNCLRNQLQKVRSEMNKDQKQLWVKMQVQRISKQVVSRNNQIERKEQLLRQQEEVVNELRENIQDLKIQIIKKQQDFSQKTRNLEDRFESQKYEYQQKIVQAAARHHSLIKQITNIHQTQLKEAFFQLQKDRVEMRKERQTCQKKCLQKVRQIEKIKLQRLKGKQELEQCEWKLKQASQKLSKQRRIIQQMQQQHQQAISSLNKKHQEQMLDLKNQLFQSKLKAVDSQNQLNDLNRLMQDLNKYLLSYKKKIKRLESQVKECSQANKVLKDQLNQSAFELQKQRQCVKSMTIIFEQQRSKDNQQLTRFQQDLFSSRLNLKKMALQTTHLQQQNNQLQIEKSILLQKLYNKQSQYDLLKQTHQDLQILHQSQEDELHAKKIQTQNQFDQIQTLIREQINLKSLIEEKQMQLNLVNSQRAKAQALISVTKNESQKLLQNLETTTQQHRIVKAQFQKQKSQSNKYRIINQELSSKLQISYSKQLQIQLLNIKMSEMESQLQKYKIMSKLLECKQAQKVCPLNLKQFYDKIAQLTLQNSELKQSLKQNQYTQLVEDLINLLDINPQGPNLPQLINQKVQHLIKKQRIMNQHIHSQSSSDILDQLQTILAVKSPILLVTQVKQIKDKLIKLKDKLIDSQGRRLRVESQLKLYQSVRNIRDGESNKSKLLN